MAITKRKLEVFILYSFLMLFPFGQLLKINIFTKEGKIGLLLIEVVALLSIIFVKKNIKVHRLLFLEMSYLLYSLLFSFLINIPVYRIQTTFGILYFIRLLIYFCFFIFLLQILESSDKLKKNVLTLLQIVGFVVAAFGLIQYLVFPDLTMLKVWGWDDHYYRLVGTFLDPAFIGLILVFSVIINIVLYIRSNNKIVLLLSIIEIITISLTYSRATYLSLVFATIYLCFALNAKKFCFYLLSFFAMSIILLPQPGGEGVNLSRTYSWEYRLQNYKETISIWKESPLFGVGYNNLSLARKYYFNADYQKYDNSLSGSDSSLLLILATGGIISFIFALRLSYILWNLNNDVYGFFLRGSIIALVIHSFFANSVFYSFVLGWMAIIISLAVSPNNKE